MTVAANKGNEVEEQARNMAFEMLDFYRECMGVWSWNLL